MICFLKLSGARAFNVASAQTSSSADRQGYNADKWVITSHDTWL